MKLIAAMAPEISVMHFRWKLKLTLLSEPILLCCIIAYRFDRDEIGTDHCAIVAEMISKNESLVLLE